MATNNTMKIELTALKSKAEVTGRCSIPVPLIGKRILGLRSRFIVLLAIATVCLAFQQLFA